MTDPRHLDYAEFIAEFIHTRPRHNGQIELAAPIFGLTPCAVEMRLRRARRKGITVEFHYYGREGHV